MPENNADSTRAALILNATTNAKKNFVQRILNPANYPVLPLRGNDYATHLMAWGEDENGYYVYPTVIQDTVSNQLKQLKPDDAYQYARRNNEFIQFDNPKDAEWFSKNYKAVWGGNRTPSLRKK